MQLYSILKNFFDEKINIKEYEQLFFWLWFPQLPSCPSFEDDTATQKNQSLSLLSSFSLLRTLQQLKSDATVSFSQYQQYIHFFNIINMFFSFQREMFLIKSITHTNKICQHQSYCNMTQLLYMYLSIAFRNDPWFDGFKIRATMARRQSCACQQTQYVPKNIKPSQNAL